MATFILNDSDHFIYRPDDKRIKLIKKESFEKFNEDILGLGKIETKSKQIEALSVIFDLEGFTKFCEQRDPQLVVPEYLSEFLKWLFQKIKDGLKRKEFSEGYQTWADLPFLSKYLGDGVLFLWDTETMSDTSIRNVVAGMLDIWESYKKDFLPLISKRVTYPPAVLRCGIAQGRIYSIGNGEDFVGPCINLSHRLQKLQAISFCFSRAGINPDDFSDSYKKQFVVKKISIRGIGDGELICVLKDEYQSLDPSDKEKFIDV
jgi:hypothetical protein